MRKNALLWSYLALAVAGVGCFAAFVFLPGLTEGWRAFFLNMGTEIVGIGLVIALIDTVIRRREERQRKRYRSVALQHSYASPSRTTSGCSPTCTRRRWSGSQTARSRA